MNQFKTLPTVSFSEAVKQVFNKPFQFTGRARRSEFWWALLCLCIINCIANLLPFIGFIAQVVIAIMGMALCFRRLHDTGHSGWWCGAQLIIGFSALILLFSNIEWTILSEAIKDNDSEAIATAITGSLSNHMAIMAGFFTLCLLNSVLLVVVFVFTLLDGQPGINRYGESTKYVSENSTHTDETLKSF